jgi:hypothetical protein
MKKLTSVLLAVVLLLTFAACNGGNDDENNTGRNNDRGNNQGGGNTGDIINPHASTRVGDTIEMGQLDWIVLAVEDGKALIISEDVLESRAYHSEWTEITWEHSDIRAYLNGEFFNSFNSTDQNKIIETTVINSNNPTHGTPGGNDTTDKIFLLSIDEANTYFTDSNSRIALNKDGNASWWLLRSPGLLSNTAASVGSGGSVDDNGRGVSLTVGFRPALWLNL